MDDLIENGQTESVLNTVKTLTINAKKYKSFLLLFHFNALKRFIKLWAKYQHNLNINGLKIKASYTVTVFINKGKYFAQKLSSIYTYIEHYHTLPPKGKNVHYPYFTLFNNELIIVAVY